MYLMRFDGDRLYVGSSVHVVRRWARHRFDLRGGVHANRFMQRLWDKGQQPSYELLEECRPGELLEREQHHVQRLRPELNLAQVVAAPMLGRVHTAQSRARMSASQRIRKERGLARPGKRVLCVELAREFASAEDAARHVQGHRGNIAAACRGVNITAYGYTWKYTGD